MEIMHHIACTEKSSPILYDYIGQSGLIYEDSSHLRVLDISESNPHWEKINEILGAEESLCLTETVFTKEELLSAEWLTLRSKWLYDYPQPENDNSYREIVYRSDCTCGSCGFGKMQGGCFRFKKTPKWGKRNFCSTNWIYDELFVSPTTKTLLEESGLTGFSFQNVQNKKGSEILADIFQLVVDEILPNGGMDELSQAIDKIEKCPDCGGKKYLGSGRGKYAFKREIFANAPDIIKSAEQFGSGWVCLRLILINQRFYKFLLENKLCNSLVFEPIELV